MFIKILFREIMNKLHKEQFVDIGWFMQRTTLCIIAIKLQWIQLALVLSEQLD